MCKRNCYRVAGTAIMLGLFTGMAYGDVFTWVGTSGGDLATAGNWQTNGITATRAPTLEGDVAHIGIGSSVLFPAAHWDSIVNVTGSTVTVPSGNVNRRANYVVDNVTLAWTATASASSFGLTNSTLFNIQSGGLTITNPASADWRMRGRFSGAGGVTIQAGSSIITYQQGAYEYLGDTYIQSGRLIIGSTTENLTRFTLSFRDNGDSMNKIYGSGAAGTRLTVYDPLNFDLSGFDWNATAEREWKVIDWDSIAATESGFSATSYSIMSGGDTVWTLVDGEAAPFMKNAAGSGRVWTHSNGGLDWTFTESTGVLSVSRGSLKLIVIH
jgi:hypothetical protein